MATTTPKIEVTPPNTLASRPTKRVTRDEPIPSCDAYDMATTAANIEESPPNTLASRPTKRVTRDNDEFENLYDEIFNAVSNRVLIIMNADKLTNVLL
jgi:hypothetical protein